MPDSPKVTVLMSVYNGEKYLKEAIESVLSQTFGDFELLIINDGSTDGTRQIIESYTDKRIRSFNQDNMGLTKSLNRGIRLARGEYIARMDADDIALPERLEKQVKFLDGHPEVAAAGSFHREEDTTRSVSDIKKFPAGFSAIRRVLLRENPISHPTVMIRKDVFAEIGLYNEDEKYRYIEDYELWRRLARGHRLDNIPEALVVRRLVPASICAVHNTKQLENAVHLRMEMLKDGTFPWWQAVYLIKPYVASKTPVRLRNLVRKYLLRKRARG